MVDTPTENKRKAAPRKIAEALAQVTPVTAALAELYGFTHPTQFEKQLENWREEITAKTNEHSQQIELLASVMTPKLVVSELALAVAIWLLESSENGLSWESIDFERIGEAFDTEEENELEKACAELEMHGWTKNSGAIGRAIHSVAPTYEAFWVLDFSVSGNSPIDDAIEIATLLVSDQSMGSISRLHSHLGWPKRRLNPALAYVLQFVGSGRISKTRQSDYVTRSVSLNHEDTMRLERFLQGI